MHDDLIIASDVLAAALVFVIMTREQLPQARQLLSKMRYDILRENTPHVPNGPKHRNEEPSGVRF